VQLFINTQDVAEGQPAQAPPALQGVAAGVVVDFSLPAEALEYPSEYQPPPLSWNELIDTNFFTSAAHSGQLLKGSSDIRC
jgi:hypothetical protein